MSTSQHQNKVVRLGKDIAALEEKIGALSDKEGRAHREKLRLEKSITKNTSDSLRRSRGLKIANLTSELGEIREKKGELENQLSDKKKALYRYEQLLSRHEEKQQKKLAQGKERDQRKLDSMQRQSQANELRYHQAVTAELSKQSELQALLHNKTVKLWRIGSFWTLLFVVISGSALLLSSNISSFWMLLLVVFAIEIFFITSGAFILRSVGDLSEKGFLQLIELAFKFQLTGLRGLKPQDIPIEE